METVTEYSDESQRHDARISGTVTRGPEIEMLMDGQPVRAFEGETVAAALLASGQRALRTTPREHQPRGMYCGIGICFDCVMTIDGLPNVRACQTVVRSGMQITCQIGDGRWSVER